MKWMLKVCWQACSLMLSPCNSLHQFGSKNIRFGGGVKIKYSSFMSVDAFTGFLSTCGDKTRSILWVCIWKQNFTDSGTERWHLSCSEQQTCSLKAASVFLRVMSVNTAKALNIPALINMSWEVCFSFSFLCVLPVLQCRTCAGKYHHQIQGCRHAYWRHPQKQVLWCIVQTWVLVQWWWVTRGLWKGEACFCCAVRSTRMCGRESTASSHVVSCWCSVAEWGLTQNLMSKAEPGC